MLMTHLEGDVLRFILPVVGIMSSVKMMKKDQDCSISLKIS